jgi:hypothetical protein
MVNDLSSLTSRRAESKAVHNVIKPSLKENEKLSSRYTLCRGSALEGIVELSLEETICPLNLLLLTKLNLVVGERLTSTAVLTWTTLSLLYRALAGETPLALEEELLPLSTAQATN